MSFVEDVFSVIDTGVSFACLRVSWSLAKEVGRLKKGVVRKPGDMVCACTHSAAFHDAEGCHDIVKVRTGHNKNGDWIMRHDDCRCVRYVGPGSDYDPGLEQDLARVQKMQDDKP